MSITEAYVSGLVDKFNISRSKAVLFGGGLAALISLIYATQGGLNFLDTVDYFINQFGVALLGLVEVVLVAWILRKLAEFKRHANEVSDIQLGAWWTISVGVITPIGLGFIMYGLFRENIIKLYDTVTGNYEWYPDFFIAYSGWAVAAVAVIVGIILSLTKWKTRQTLTKDKKEGVI